MNVTDVRVWWESDLPESAEVIYFDSYSDWSWSSVLLVYQLWGKIYIQDNVDRWCPYETDDDRALEAMVDFEDMLGTFRTRAV